LAKNRGFSKDPRIRARQEGMLEAYAEQVATIGSDPAKDRAAQITAVERKYSRPQTDEAKLRQFQRLWKSDEAREYLRELWGLAVEEAPDPVSVAFQTVYAHMRQEDESWGPRDRGVSLAASRVVLGIFVPNQTNRTLMGHVSTKIERPETYDQEPAMASRTILPAGTTIAKPTGPTGEADDDEEDDDDE
jgi:hypothetical protein